MCDQTAYAWRATVHTIAIRMRDNQLLFDAVDKRVYN